MLPQRPLDPWSPRVADPQACRLESPCRTRNEQAPALNVLGGMSPRELRTSLAPGAPPASLAAAASAYNGDHVGGQPKAGVGGGGISQWYLTRSQACNLHWIEESPLPLLMISSSYWRFQDFQLRARRTFRRSAVSGCKPPTRQNSLSS
ncbi:hypothetical protein SETIT_2G366100v2 [Setaria italica]|uniref:Uncharacterized protein n=1 Tax=Setaria italica TaxID=4555 RepID=A0A368Q6S2_SETIT|nr:hypothetical protein SETIT_2G366100v2 [Setaria italica]